MHRLFTFITFLALFTSANAAESKLNTPKTKTYSHPIAEIITSEGTLTVELFENECPNTVANFISLAESGFYKGMSFHRIIKNFMAQGGCPNSKEGARGVAGTGGPGYTFNNEKSRAHKVSGLLSMANAGTRFGKGTNGSQFFLTFVPCPWLDGKHTVFGQVIKGKSILKKLENHGSRRGKVSKRITFDVKIISKNKESYTVKKN